MKRKSLGLSFAIVLPVEAGGAAHALIRNTLKNYSAYDGDGHWTDDAGKRHHEQHIRYEGSFEYVRTTPYHEAHRLAMQVLAASGEQAVYYLVDGEPHLAEREAPTDEDAPETVRSEPHPEVASQPVSVETVEPIDLETEHTFECDFSQDIKCKRRSSYSMGAWFQVGEIARAMRPEEARKLGRLLIAIADSY